MDRSAETGRPFEITADVPRDTAVIDWVLAGRPCNYKTQIGLNNTLSSTLFSQRCRTAAAVTAPYAQNPSQIRWEAGPQ
jgi:hypothetical protein